MYQHTQQHSDKARIVANSAQAAVIDLSLSSSEDEEAEDTNSDSDNSIDIVRKDPPRPLVPVPSRVNNTVASTSQQFRHPATILPRPQSNNTLNPSSSKQYFQPQLNQAAFASTSAAFKTSAKSRAMLNMTTEHAKLGLPISVPKIGSSTSTSSIHAFKSPPAQSTSTNQQERRRDRDEMGLNDFTSPADGEKALRELVESTMDMENVDLSAAMPDNMNCTLLPHQILGVHWLKDREKGKRGGGILADDVSRLPPLSFLHRLLR
jgi:SNF2 family DNA or RNA helicase